MQKKKPYLTPILIICAVIICLIMVRLGFWQLDRAEQKRVILNQSVTLSELAAVDLKSLMSEVNLDSNKVRFRHVFSQGEYLHDESILIDNQVLDTRVGYSLLTPFKLSGTNTVVLVDRGWLPVGESRQQQPKFETPQAELALEGRLNLPYAEPPLWDDKFDVSNGIVWQYLPISLFSEESGLSVLPLVLELAPTEIDDMAKSGAKISWREINDEWVFKHQAYALQWFSMALVFFIACLIVLTKSRR